MGECSDEAEEYARSLNREIVAPEKEESIHIYFKKIHVEFHNGTVLASLPGELIQLHRIDSGHTNGLEKIIPRVVAVKPGCKIMLLYNVSDSLKNGYQGEFIGADPYDENKVIVNFPAIGTITMQ